MRKLIKQICLLQIFLAILFLVPACNSSQSGEKTDDQTAQWFEGRKWLNGFDRQPHKSINEEEFKKQYEANQAAWDKAFAYLKETNLSDLTLGRHEIDGDNVYALVTQGPPKHPDTAKWESHQKYIDIHCVISGKEQMGIAPVDSATNIVPYNETKDIGFYTANGHFYESDPGIFFIVFPPDAHCPGVKVDGYDEVKKIVIKIKKAV